MNMKSNRVLDTTTNRSVFNREYKEYLSYIRGGISCGYCRYHRGENNTNRFYGGYLKDCNINTIRFPNWKLVSKNTKQWMKSTKRIDTKYQQNFEHF